MHTSARGRQLPDRRQGSPGGREPHPEDVGRKRQVAEELGVPPRRAVGRLARRLAQIAVASGASKSYRSVPWCSRARRPRRCALPDTFRPFIARVRPPANRQRRLSPERRSDRSENDAEAARDIDAGRGAKRVRAQRRSSGSRDAITTAPPPLKRRRTRTRRRGTPAGRRGRRLEPLWPTTTTAGQDASQVRKGWLAVPSSIALEQLPGPGRGGSSGVRPGAAESGA